MCKCSGSSEAVRCNTQTSHVIKNWRPRCLTRQLGCLRYASTLAFIFVALKTHAQIYASTREIVCFDFLLKTDLTRASHTINNTYLALLLRSYVPKAHQTRFFPHSKSPYIVHPLNVFQKSNGGRSVVQVSLGTADVVRSQRLMRLSAAPLHRTLYSLR